MIIMSISHKHHEQTHDHHEVGRHMMVSMVINLLCVGKLSAVIIVVMTLTASIIKPEKEQSPTHRIQSSPRKLSAKNSTRLALLATPKDSKATWWTSFGPRLTWGNQELMWPLCPAALKYVPTQRLCVLAKPKRDHTPVDTFSTEFQYSCGRESQIWKVSHRAKTAIPSNRVTYLAQPKTVPEDYLKHRYQFVFSCGRESPIWRPSKSSMMCNNRPHTAQLSIPKSPHYLYQPPRQVQTIVSEAAKKCVTSSKIETLAKPKVRPEGPFREPEWPVSTGAKQADATERLVELARPKRIAEGYEPSRDVIWKVTTGAKTATASARLDELSKPIVRDTMDHLQFNPDAFQVSEAAKKAIVSSRIEELAQPIQRGR